MVLATLVQISISLSVKLGNWLNQPGIFAAGPVSGGIVPNSSISGSSIHQPTRWLSLRPVGNIRSKCSLNCWYRTNSSGWRDGSRSRTSWYIWASIRRSIETGGAGCSVRGCCNGCRWSGTNADFTTSSFVWRSELEICFIPLALYVYVEVSW